MTSTTAQQFESWLRLVSETEAVEFKLAQNNFPFKSLCEYCVAISNELGGHLILGVVNDRGKDGKREVVGTSAFSDLSKIKKDVFDEVKFRVEVEEFHYEGKRILIFYIPSRLKSQPRELDGRYLMRVGESTIPMTSEQLKCIYDEGKEDWLVGVAKAGCTSQQVIELLDTQIYFDRLKSPYPTTQEQVIAKLEEENLIARIGAGFNISNLGAMLLAKDLKKFGLLYRKIPRVIVYDGLGKQKTKLDVQGSKGYAVGLDDLILYLMGQVPGNEVVEQAVRREVKMFPEQAVRELVANAIIHQDFNITGTYIVIELYDNRLEISNPGIPIVDTDIFINSYQSRNEKLADIMRRFGFCEEKGSGIDNVFSVVEAYQLPAPDFSVFEDHTVVTLFAHKEFENMDRAERVRACYQHCCLKYVMKEKMTNSTLRERFQLPKEKYESVSRVLKDALDDGKIKIADSGASSNRYRSYLPYWG